MKQLISLLFLTLFSFTALTAAPFDSASHQEALKLIDSIEQPNLQKQIRFNYEMGSFDDLGALREIIDRARQEEQRSAFVSESLRGRDGDLQERLQKLARAIKELDKESVNNVKLVEHNKAARTNLFQDLSCDVAKSYKSTFDLCKQFNPRSQTNDHKKLDEAIDSYLNDMGRHPAIKYALKVTDTTIEDLKKSWFGPGLGFEHVFAGELKGSKVSGYHWWYTYYEDERKGRTVYNKSLEGLDDPKIFTGSFRWDPDGSNGPLKPGYKSKGGFIIGNSAQAMLALGHVALCLAKKAGINNAFTFRADINGAEYVWQMYIVGGTIRSLYPMVPHRLERSVYERMEEYRMECAQ